MGELKNRDTVDVFLPPSRERLLDYATCEKLQFEREHLNEEGKIAKNPGPYAYNPHLKMLCNDVSFLTEKATAGDRVLYVGGSVGAYVLLLAQMFPTVKFTLYDHNMSNSVKKAKEASKIYSSTFFCKQKVLTILFC
jgi:hypothetical protein